MLMQKRRMLKKDCGNTEVIAIVWYEYLDYYHPIIPPNGVVHVNDDFRYPSSIEIKPWSMVANPIAENVSVPTKKRIMLQMQKDSDLARELVWRSQERKLANAITKLLE